MHAWSMLHEGLLKTVHDGNHAPAALLFFNIFVLLETFSPPGVSGRSGKSEFLQVSCLTFV